MFSILANAQTGVDTFIETSRQWIEKEGCKVHLIYIVDVKYGLPKVKKRNGNIRAELPGIDEPVRQMYYRGNERIDEVTPKYALLGTHAGRRTFALGIPPQVVMKWTGHSDYKAEQPHQNRVSLEL